ncbi:MAG: 7-cyano-7-deazaguanine synthase [Planctomycetes bacterium]|nr:7-cyano-7-deazaguanine synthase [Planctomycetota bacterium]
MDGSLDPVVVLLGAGVESTALVKRYLTAGHVVCPVHVHCGLIWDDCETAFARRFCQANASSRLLPLLELRLPLSGFLGNHWAVTGVNVPQAGAPAADLEIPLRNLTLLGFALHAVRRSARHRELGFNPRVSDADSPPPASTVPIQLALGTTADNSYPDGNRHYFDQCEPVLSLEAGQPVRILTPLIHLSKLDVIRGSDRETLALSFSCVQPQEGGHCGQCIKCGKRRAAFRAAGVDDPTHYAC